MIGSNVAKLLAAPVIVDLKNGFDLRHPRDCEIVKSAMVFDCAAPTEGIGSNNFSDVARIPLNLLAHKPKHYVYCSSSCVYPDSEEMPIPTNEEWGVMGEPEKANRGYGWGKRCGELACKYSDVPCTIVRPSNIYGPSYDWSIRHKHVIPSLIEKMLSGGSELIVWGNGHQTRSFMYEEDCASLIVSLSRHTGTFNLGGEEISIGELVSMLVDLTGYKGTVIFDDTKPVGPLRKAQDTRRLNHALGAVVLMPFKEGLRRTVDAAVRNHRTLESANRA